MHNTSRMGRYGRDNGRASSSGYRGVRVQRAWVLGGYEGDWGGADGLGLTIPGHGIRAKGPISRLMRGRGATGSLKVRRAGGEES